MRHKQKFDKHSKAQSHVVCHKIPKGGTRKLISSGRRPHNFNDVLQVGRLKVLDTRQKVHFEHLKKNVNWAARYWAAHQPFGLYQNEAIVVDPFVEESNEKITSVISKDSFLSEQLPEASIEVEPTRPIPPHMTQTRTQTALEQGILRRRLSHFGYPFESESDHEMIEQPIEETQQPVVFPELDDLKPLHSDQDEIFLEPACNI